MTQECHPSHILNTEFSMPKDVPREVLEEAVRRRFPEATVQKKTVHVVSDPQEMPGVRNKRPDENVYWIEHPFSGTVEDATAEINAFLKEFTESRGYLYEIGPRDPR